MRLAPEELEIFGRYLELLAVIESESVDDV